jgi:hypothetical protein
MKENTGKSEQPASPSEFDVVIIGAGVSGLVCYTELVKKYPNSTILILEKNDRIGGRLYDVLFHNQPVHLGGWLIRKDDSMLQALLKKYEVPISKISIDFEYDIPDYDKKWYDYHLKKIVQIIKNMKQEEDEPFHQFLMSYFGRLYHDPEETVAAFLKFEHHSSFSDFFKASTIHFINYIPEDLEIRHQEFYQIISDLKSKKPGSWNQLFDKIAESIPESDIRLNFEVETIKRIPQCKYKVSSSDGDDIIANHIIITHSDVMNKVPVRDKNPVCIFKIPFVKIFSYHPDGIPIKKPTVVQSMVKKLFPITDKIMLATYADTKDAEKIFKMRDSESNREKQNKMVQNWLEKELKKELGDKFTRISDIRSQFWETGTHAFIPKAEYPSKGFHKYKNHNIWLIGEMVSNHQGWTEGCLESVYNFINNAEFEPNNRYYCEKCKKSFPKISDAGKHYYEAHKKFRSPANKKAKKEVNEVVDEDREVYSIQTRSKIEKNKSSKKGFFVRRKLATKIK